MDPGPGLTLRGIGSGSSCELERDLGLVLSLRDIGSGSSCELERDRIRVQL